MTHYYDEAIRAKAAAVRYQGTLYVVRGRPGQNDRPALPAGHPISWGAITRGTVLDSAIYPFPVFGP